MYWYENPARRVFRRVLRQAEVDVPGANTSGVPFCRYPVYCAPRSSGATASAALSEATGVAHPSPSFANSGMRVGVATAR